MRKVLLAFVALTIGSLASAQTAAPPVAPPLTPENTLVLDLSTGGRVTIAMRPDVAPKHVERIRTLVREHFYDGTIFHRVIDGFMAQGGDPTGTGTGGSKLPNLKAEFNDLPHVRGAVAMARASDNDSANSQFYICLAPALKLDRSYTVWGRVTSGMEYVDAIEKGEPPANPSKIVHASIGSDNYPAPAPSTPIPSSATPLAPAADTPMPGMPLPTKALPTLPPEAPAKPRHP
ncbi:peptidylprolyl isomerase [Polymorphobacter sp. PAMC 29334]|uniref:peptidylprolyl isomerase n=1 Tax=Polymorphobacter sp. PAMC 29334 TaxID=2862331 RepID=UPI001D02126D|nr:peptidylprolyl isomerase [Polymorphobacter sp. PAMC 29334]